MTAHGGVVVGPGNPRIIINGKPAVCVGDQHFCPACSPNPHGGGPSTGPGVPNVLFSGRPALTVQDLCICASCPSFIVMGSPNVLIGTGGGGGPSGGRGTSEKAQAIKALQSGAIKPVKGTETLLQFLMSGFINAPRRGFTADSLWGVNL